MTKMSWIEKITPKNTEEIKPNLFIQKTKTGYRQIYPAAWNGKINWYNFLVGKHFWRGLIYIAIILYIAYWWYQDTTYCREFQENPCDYLPNITDYCLDLEEVRSNERGDTYILSEDSGKTD